jgi:2-hydroxychromene-2-carboxylate isomerase
VAVTSPAASDALVVLFDFKDPYSYLAVAPVRAFLAEVRVPASWVPFIGSPLREHAPPGPDADRGAHHRWFRARYQAGDLDRYARARGLPARRFRDGGLYRQASGELAALGFNWATGAGPVAAGDYLDRVFAGWWDGALDIDRASDVADALIAAGVDTDGFDVYVQEEGLAELAAQREAAVASGGFATPALLLDGEAFLGRQHLPYLAYRLRRQGEGV